MSTVPELEERFVIVILRSPRNGRAERRYYTGLRDPETDSRLLATSTDDPRTLRYCHGDIARKEIAHHLADLGHRVFVEHAQVARQIEGAYR